MFKKNKCNAVVEMPNFSNDVTMKGVGDLELSVILPEAVEWSGQPSTRQ